MATPPGSCKARFSPVQTHPNRFGDAFVFSGLRIKACDSFSVMVLCLPFPEHPMYRTADSVLPVFCADAAHLADLYRELI